MELKKISHNTGNYLFLFRPLKKVWELGDREYHCEDDDPKLISVHKYQ